MKQTYSGGCHCGAVRYQADIDLGQGTVKCNCSICAKSRTWLTSIGATEFRLESGADALTVYSFGTQRMRHMFCKHCGVKCYGHARMPDAEFIAVVISTLESVPDAELATLPVTYVDGRNDNFNSAPQETRHL